MAVIQSDQHSVQSKFTAAAVASLTNYEPENVQHAERIIRLFARQTRSESGFPRIRPSDCRKLFEAVRNIYNENFAFFRTCDVEIIKKFDEIVEAAANTDIVFYPAELLKLRLLQAESRLVRGDAHGARKAIESYIERPYASEVDFDDLATLFWLDGQIRVELGKVEGISSLFSARVVNLSRFELHQSWHLVRYFAPFIAIGRPEQRKGWSLTSLMSISAAFALKRKRERELWLSGTIDHLLASAALAFSGLCLFSITALGNIQRYYDHKTRPDTRNAIVTRAMGGIGDLLMMTPGLRALAARQKKPVKLAVSRKFFPIFANNPSVELVDIDGPAFDPSSFGDWYNLTLCPAGAYESRTRPFVKKGRAELFARAMRVSRRDLDQHGWCIEVNLDDQQIAFRDKFLVANKLGRRALIGVQPFSRDAYKDHPHIVPIIERLARDYDVLLFHHRAEGLPAGTNLFSTAGLELSQSLALVSTLDVMVTIDSAFLHAASAFDIPTVAMFGPTDANLFTRHHSRVTILETDESFPCLPCWRNEDLPCHVTGQTGISPCIAAVTPDAVMQAVEHWLAQKPASETRP